MNLINNYNILLNVNIDNLKDMCKMEEFINIFGQKNLLMMD